MAKKIVAFLTGGYSGEAEISYLSAITINKNLDREKYDVYTIDIRPDGWWYKADDGSETTIDKNDFSLTLAAGKIQFDVVLIGIHGTPGEDGKLQGYLDMMGLPYTSCDAATSALTFNKRYTVAVAAFGGIHVAKSLHLFKHREYDTKSILAQLKLPYFVKPNNGGSSIGMSKVTKGEDLSAAIQKAFQEDSQVLIEEFIAGREFTIGVFRSKGEIITLPFTEIIAKNEFFDFEAKYHGKSEEITPAKVDESVAEKVRAAARQVYGLFNCRGVIRIDFIYNESVGAPYMLEINTVPGQSEASLVPQQVRAMGWSLKEFYSALVDEALTGK
ncbi:MAG TPA: D-alanine--D-alanine ligase [Flavihumibacter sp.]|nr:D-alanine--D-alanine ligase [Flavihumibacter sp.]HQD10024.1 D-alanine--D-alanine ligase [Flavihumibacter sp.]